MEKEKHLLFICIPAYGHIIPLLELARKISQFHQATFAVSGKMARDLITREIFDEVADRRIHLYPIPDGIVDDMESPDDHEMFRKLLPMMFGGIITMLNNIPTESSVSKITEFTRPVDGVITDNFTGRAAGVCIQREIPLYLFNPCPVLMSYMILCAHESLKTAPEEELDGFLEVPDDAGNFTKPLPEELLHQFLLPMKTVYPYVRAVIVNSVREFEADGIRKCLGKPGMNDVPFFCVGPILPEPKKVVSVASPKATVEQKVLNWLDAKAPSSVIYISFGSVAVPNPDQLRELVEAVRMTNKPVLWSLKAGSHQHLPEDLSRATSLSDPSGKVLVLAWAPQKKILAHVSVGVFVSHCGWNSTLEGLAGGKPIVAWPQFAEQLINAEFVAAHGVGEVLWNAGSNKEARLVSAPELLHIISRVKREKTEAASEFQSKLQAAIQPEGSSRTEFDRLIAYIAKQ